MDGRQTLASPCQDAAFDCGSNQSVDSLARTFWASRSSLLALAVQPWRRRKETEAVLCFSGANSGLPVVRRRKVTISGFRKDMKGSSGLF